MPSVPSQAGDRLLHASPARTVLRRRTASGDRVVKVLTAGAMVDAERELAMATLAAGPGVVEHFGCEPDPASGRPSLHSRWIEGHDLARHVAMFGAMPPAVACATLAEVAATLARLHGSTSPAAPRGLVHGDVKPANVLLTADGPLLLDFEHAAAIGSARPPGGGTPGFAAPELATGNAAESAQDVFALGVTLAWLLDGGGPRQPWPDAVRELIAGCTAASAAARPDAGEVAERLRAIAAALRQHRDEQLRQDWARAVFTLSPPPASELAASAAARTWRQRHRLCIRRPQLLAKAPPIPARPAAIAAELRRASRVLQRFPNHAEALRWRAELQQTGALLVAEAAKEVQTRQRDDDLAGASMWLDELERLLRALQASPGGCQVPCDDPVATSLLQRDPFAFLQRLRTQLSADAAELAEQQHELGAALARLDLPAAERAIERLAARHGGTAAVVARHRDRLHRLAFHLDRIDRAAATVARLEPLWREGQLQPLRDLVNAARTATHRLAERTATVARGDVGLRSLHLTLQQLRSDCPEFEAVAPALAVLSRALAALSDEAAELLADARVRLRVEPVPVRPLQLLLGRLDTLRALEAFVDRPGRSRSELLDGLENVRLALEQARATRDRLAEAAEHALARGHWTTGLFDMERAAGMQPPDDGEARPDDRLQARLAAARQRKLEVDTAARRNVDLANAYATMQDDPASTFERRLQTLTERRDSLTFLALHAPADRAAMYRRDLREIETLLALERAGDAEQQLHATTDVLARLQLVTSTLDQLGASVTTSGDAPAPPGRVQRLIDHWRALATDCRAAVDAMRSAAAQRKRQRRRMWAIAAIAVLASGAAAALALRPWLAPDVVMANEQPK